MCDKKTYARKIEYFRQYREKNRELLREKARRYEISSRGKEVRYKYVRSEKAKAYNKLYRETHRDERKIVDINWRAKTKGVPGVVTSDEWRNLKEVYGFICCMCQRREPDITLTPDHKIPLSKGGTNYIDNIQPLCFSCNIRKNDRTWFASCPIIPLQFMD